MSKTIRCYDYVNHPYEAVRDALKANALAVFQKATTTAARRAQNVSSELHVNIGGIDVGTDISISVQKMEDYPKKTGSPPTTIIELEWSATKRPGLFPLMKAKLSVYPLTGTETQLDFLGSYVTPLGLVGDTLDSIVGRRIAEASVHRFIMEVAAYLRDQLSQPT